MAQDEVSSSYGEYIVSEASDNGDYYDSDEEDQDGDTDDLEIGAHYKNPFFNSEKKSCPNGWISVNELQPHGDVLGRYQQPRFNPNEVRVGFKLPIPFSHWSDYVECEWWIDESYHPSMKLITIGMA